jgi:hypothetical protein
MYPVSIFHASLAPDMKGLHYAPITTYTSRHCHGIIKGKKREHLYVKSKAFGGWGAEELSACMAGAHGGHEGCTPRTTQQGFSKIKLSWWAGARVRKIQSPAWPPPLKFLEAQVRSRSRTNEFHHGRSARVLLIQRHGHCDATGKVVTRHSLTSFPRIACNRRSKSGGPCVIVADSRLGWDLPKYIAQGRVLNSRGLIYVV